MAPRAQWKGFLKFGEVSAPVALYTAASTSERISFSIVNRATGNRVKREYIDSETDQPVEKDDQVKGYEIENNQYIVIEPEEVAATVPESDKTLRVMGFIDCKEIDKVFFDKPYYLTPDKAGTDIFSTLRESMKKENVAAIAQAVLFRRVRTVLIRPHGNGLIATTMNFDYEVRDAKEAFSNISDIKLEGEMLDLAKHIIKTKKGSFELEEVEDRYEVALAELVKAKMEGKSLPKRAAPKVSKPNDLLQALRESAGIEAQPRPKRTVSKTTAASSRGKASRATPAAKKETSTRQRKAG